MANRNVYKIEMLLLRLLEEEDYYGYQLTQTLKERSGGHIKIAEGTMYPILYRLLEHGLISDHKKKVGKRQTRVYYHLEPKGKEHLDSLMADYYKMIDAIQTILGPRE